MTTELDLKNRRQNLTDQSSYLNNQIGVIESEINLIDEKDDLDSN